MLTKPLQHLLTRFYHLIQVSIEKIIYGSTLDRILLVVLNRKCRPNPIRTLTPTRIPTLCKPTRCRIILDPRTKIFGNFKLICGRFSSLRFIFFLYCVSSEILFFVLLFLLRHLLLKFIILCFLNIGAINMTLL